VIFKCRIAAEILLLIPLMIFMTVVYEGHKLHSQYLSNSGESIRRSSRPCCQIKDIFEPARRLADWSTSRYRRPSINRTGNLGVLLEVLEAVSLSIWVVWLITVLRSSSSSSQSIGSNGGAISVQNREFSGAGKFSGENYNKEQAGHDLYYLWQHLHYIWPRRAPHRPNRPAEGLGLSGQATRPGFSAGLLRALLVPVFIVWSFILQLSVSASTTQRLPFAIKICAPRPARQHRKFSMSRDFFGVSRGR
jgi:hypothetical protein